MFTGLVEEIGSIKSIYKGNQSARLAIQASHILQDVKIGDSISTNGVCLTVTDFDQKYFTVDVMAETMRKSNLKDLKIGSEVNLERALRVGDRLGGHFVSGHIDGTGRIKEFIQEENAVWVYIETYPEILKYIVYKGSIAIDGISLTVAYVDQQGFKVSIIPHTHKLTTLLKRKIGEEVNLECDMVGKYIEKFLGVQEEQQDKKKIDMDFLRGSGFL